MDVEKQITYWRTGAEEDFIVAQDLFEKGYCRHALYFGYSTIEKILKAHLTKVSNAIPAKIQDLSYLARLAHLQLEKSQKELLQQLNPFKQEGLYPKIDGKSACMSKKDANSLLMRTRETFYYLNNQL